MVNPEEQDAFTSWRKVYAYLQRAGAVKQVKQRANRRERRAAHQRDWKKEYE